MRGDAYTEAAPAAYDSRDRQIAVRWALIDALKKCGRAMPTKDLVPLMGMTIGAQAIAMAATREPRYFVISGKYNKGKAKGKHLALLVDLHPHLKPPADGPRAGVGRNTVAP